MNNVQQVEAIFNKVMDHRPKSWVSCRCRIFQIQRLHGLEMGSFLHACEGEIVCESNNAKIPYFNAPIYLENKVSRPHIGGDAEWLIQGDRRQLARWMKF